MHNSMNKQSLTSLNKISLQMDRLSSLISKQQKYHYQLQSLLKKQEEQSNESSQIQNLDEYFKEYDNPTTKSLPIDDDSNLSAQIQEEDTQIINTIYRIRQEEESEEEDKENLHDDKSTVILNATKNPHRKEKQREDQHNLAKANVNYYSSVNQDNRSKKELLLKNKKICLKNPTSSMPSEIIASKQHQKSSIQKNGSISKYPAKIESPVSSQLKPKKPHNEGEHESNFIRQLKGKLSKVSKIDREQLNRLQQKKLHKKTELSSNRRKTKRDLGTAKSTANMTHTQKTSQTNIHIINNKTYSNASCKIFESKKKDSVKKNQDRGLSNHEWQKNIQKANKKLNRVNICKLQENMKKNNEKKSQIKDLGSKKVQKTLDKKTNKKDNERRQLKLHFTQNDETAMKKIIDQKDLNREYTKETDKYFQAMKTMSKNYFQILIKECRQTSEQAIFKIKLVTLILYFFDQFASSSLITHVKIDPKTEQFFTKIPEEEIIDILLHPKKILVLMADFPNILMGDNVISSERIQIFNKKFEEINDQLDQQLEFFLIKKTALFMFVHSLLEYMNFLMEKELVTQTKRTKLIPIQSEKKLQGYYSSRSKRDEISKKYIKKTEKSNKFGFRCDSDRKITLQDEQLFLKGAFNNNNMAKSNPLKKIFK